MDITRPLCDVMKFRIIHDDTDSLPFDYAARTVVSLRDQKGVTYEQIRIFLMPYDMRVIYYSRTKSDTTANATESIKLCGFEGIGHDDVVIGMMAKNPVCSDFCTCTR